MAPPWLFAGDEELGKRNDDHRPGSKGALLSSWPPVGRKTLRMRRRRILLAIVGVIIFYLFIKGVTFSPGDGLEDGTSPGSPSIPSGPPPRQVQAPAIQDPEASEHYYSGKIKFYNLALSLRSIWNTRGHRPNNQNVLFSAASLKSAAVLIPMACEMARWNRNNVHFVLQGREDLSLSSVKEINGVGSECNVYWHDGRADYSPYSSDLRLAVTITAGLDHIDSYMHPQAVIIDGSGREEDVFKDAVREKARTLGKTVISLPVSAAENMMWLTRLDSGALKAWDKVDLDILIHVPQESLGNLKRLLRSLRSADYFSSPLPRMTIELPSVVDIPTRQYLEEFAWPPLTGGADRHASQVTIRHRIPHHVISSEEAATRFFESFYPSNPANSHVLVLSPQTQLSPLYYHYLKYTLLEYKYSSYRSAQYDDIFGIALDVPSVHLNGSTPFTPPTGGTGSSTGSADPSYMDEMSSFLWQAPSSNAALYFGSSWVMLHDFLRNRLEAQHTRKVSSSPKVVSANEPPWMNYILELMRLRGYSLFYPPNSVSNAFATVHNELRQLREEFSDAPPTAMDETEESEQSFSADPVAYLSGSHKPEKSLTSKKSLLTLLPLEGDLPELGVLPQLSYDGTSSSSLSEDNEAYAAAFRKDGGGCGVNKLKRRSIGSVSDLFCSEDDDDEDEDENPDVANVDGGDAQEVEGGDDTKSQRDNPNKSDEEDESPDTRRARAEKGEGVMTWLDKLNHATPSAENARQPSSTSVSGTVTPPIAAGPSLPSDIGEEPREPS